MSRRNQTSDELTETEVGDIARTDAADTAGPDEAPKKLSLETKIVERSTCQRHVTVSVARDDIERYFNDAFGNMMDSAAVPGFRAGRAPRKLVESRYRKDVAQQVKGSLLSDSIAQIIDDEKLVAIGEPDFDLQVVEVPDTGPMTFEFDLEVRPEFDLPNWHGLNINRPVREFTEADVDRHLHNVLAHHGRLVPHDGPARAGDYIVCRLTFKNGDETISSSDEEVIRIRPVLSFRDGKIEKFDKFMAGINAGETRITQAHLSDDAPNELLRGKTIDAEFDVKEVKRLELPELTPQFLQRLGDFESEAELRSDTRLKLERQMSYEQQRQARLQILTSLTATAYWTLPPDLLRRQASRELQRSILELQRNGFSDSEIDAHENEIRQNSMAATARSLKEHFILERIAEDEKLDVSSDDYDDEIELIAAQAGENPRRVRARLEKQGLMDALRNQIIERKTIELILAEAKFRDVPYEPASLQAEALDQSAGGGEDPDEAIPEAQFPDGPTAPPTGTAERG